MISPYFSQYGAEPLHRFMTAWLDCMSGSIAASRDFARLSRGEAPRELGGCRSPGWLTYPGVSISQSGWSSLQLTSARLGTWPLPVEPKRSMSSWKLSTGVNLRVVTSAGCRLHGQVKLLPSRLRDNLSEPPLRIANRARRMAGLLLARDEYGPLSVLVDRRGHHLPLNTTGAVSGKGLLQKGVDSPRQSVRSAKLQIG